MIAPWVPPPRKGRKALFNPECEQKLERELEAKTQVLLDLYDAMPRLYDAMPRGFDAEVLTEVESNHGEMLSGIADTYLILMRLAAIQHRPGDARRLARLAAKAARRSRRLFSRLRVTP